MTVDLPSGLTLVREMLAEDLHLATLVTTRPGRLSELSAAGLITKDGNGDYTRTPLGADLGSALDPLDRWSQRWVKQQKTR